MNKLSLLLVSILSLSAFNINADAQLDAQIIGEAKASPKKAVELVLHYPELYESIREVLPEDDKAGFKAAVAKEIKWRAYECLHDNYEHDERKCAWMEENNDNPRTTNFNQSIVNAASSAFGQGKITEKQYLFIVKGVIANGGQVAIPPSGS